MSAGDAEATRPLYGHADALSVWSVQCFSNSLYVAPCLMHTIQQANVCTSSPLDQAFRRHLITTADAEHGHVAVDFVAQKFDAMRHTFLAGD